jgi:hypothetical protein
MERTESIAAANRRRAGNPRRGSNAWRTALLTLGLLLGATAAHAADTCFRDCVGDISVFKKFRMPRPGDCKPLTGYTHNSGATLDGTACAATEGTWVYLNFTYLISATKFGTAHFEIRRATESGIGHGCDGRVDGNAWGCSNFSVSKVTCPKPAAFGF